MWFTMHTMRRIHPTGGPALATAQSNVATDHLLTGCKNIGMKVVRLGHPSKVSPSLRSSTMDVLVRSLYLKGRFQSLG